MSFLLMFFAVALGAAWFVSGMAWMRMLIWVPVAALIPAFFGTASNCGADFVLYLGEAGQCSASDAPEGVLASFYVLAIGAVLVASVVVKAVRGVMGR